MPAAGAEPRSSRRPRGGFTWVELLICLACAGLLLALLLPAVQASRAAAREAACRNHLRQIGLGLEQHTARDGRLPGGDRLGWSPQARLAGWLGAKPLADRLPTGRWSHEADWARIPGGGPASVPTPAVLRCPSDGDVPDGYTNYLFNAGAGRPGSGPAAGPFPLAPLAEGLPPARVRDGLSQTATFSEGWTGGTPPHRVVPLSRYTYLNTPDATPYLRTDCGTLPDADRARGLPVRGESWAGGGLWLPAYTHAVPPLSAPACLNGGDFGSGLWPADGGHRGVVNVLLGDGAVRPAAATIDPDLWSALGSRAGGEVAAFE